MIQVFSLICLVLRQFGSNLTPYQPVREAVSYRGLFTASWFGVREKYCYQLEIYDRLRASEQAVYILCICATARCG